jgi:hypothetical protein
MRFDITASQRSGSTMGTAWRVALVTGAAALAAVATSPAPAGGGNEIPCDQAGPQAPRDVTSTAGANPVSFALAPPPSNMHLCDIHFHRYAEHRAGGYSQVAGDGDHRGYVCNGANPAAAHVDSHGEVMDVRGSRLATPSRYIGCLRPVT